MSLVLKGYGRGLEGLGYERPHSPPVSFAHSDLCLSSPDSTLVLNGTELAEDPQGTQSFGLQNGVGTALARAILRFEEPAARGPGVPEQWGPHNTPRAQREAAQDHI